MLIKKKKFKNIFCSGGGRRINSLLRNRGFNVTDKYFIISNLPSPNVKILFRCYLRNTKWTFFIFLSDPK